MKRFLVGVCSLAVFSQAYSGAGSLYPGSSMTGGASSNKFSLYAGLNNPAMGSLIIEEDERFRSAYLGSFSTVVEVGAVDNFEDDLDALIDLIEDPSLAEGTLDETLDYYNDVLVRMGDNGYLKNSLNIHVPFLPIFHRSDILGGTLALDVSLGTQVSMSVLDDVLVPTSDSGGIITNTSLYLKSGIEKKLSLAFSRPLEFKALPESGALFAGVRASIINMELSKQVIWLQDLDGQSVSDVISDRYDDNLISTTALAIDAGLIWVANKYTLGLSLDNLNSPSFDYGVVGENCDALNQGSFEQSSCYVANFFVEQGDIRSDESHVRHAVITANAQFNITSRLSISSALDLAAYDDVVGYENQHVFLSAAYDAKSFIGVSTRLAYQANLVGTELSTVNAGFTLFNAITFDFMYGLESTSVDGSSVPRVVGFSIGFEEQF